MRGRWPTLPSWTIPRRECCVEPEACCHVYSTDTTVRLLVPVGVQWYCCYQARGGIVATQFCAVWLHSEVTRCKDTAGDLVHVMTTTNPDFPLLAPVSAFLLLPTSPADTSAIVRMR